MYRLFFLLLVPILSYATPPSWFFNLEHANNDIIGYGVNSSIDKAKQSAMMDITHSISVSIESNVDVSTGDDNGKADSNTFIDSHTTSRAKLTGIKFIKIEHIDDMWYIAAKYDNSPIELKFKKKLSHINANELQNKYIKNTPLVISLNDELKYNLDYELLRKDSLWQIKYKNIIFPINQKNFYRLFSNQTSKNISITPNKKVYAKGDNFFINIDQYNPGYVSILYVEHNGKVGVISANYESKKSFVYPNPTTDSDFKISNPYQNTVRELYVVIYSKTRVNLAEFEGVSNRHLDESNYNFDKLITLLNKSDFSTYQIKIRN